MADEGTPNVDPIEGGTSQENAESTTPITGEGAGAVQETGATPNVDVKEGGTADDGAAAPVDLKLPEGLPPQVLEFAKANGLSQAQLDASLQFFGEVAHVNATTQQQQLRQLGEAHVQSWGKEGQYKLSVGRRALKMVDPEGVLTTMLNETGYGNHPAVLQSLYELGTKLQEGGFISATQNRAPGKRTAAQAMYGDTHPSKEI